MPRSARPGDDCRKTLAGARGPQLAADTLKNAMIAGRTPISWNSEDEARRPRREAQDGTNRFASGKKAIAIAAKEAHAAVWGLRSTRRFRVWAMRVTIREVVTLKPVVRAGT
jgi:hypothetical protein